MFQIRAQKWFLLAWTTRNENDPKMCCRNRKNQPVSRGLSALWVSRSRVRRFRRKAAHRNPYRKLSGLHDTSRHGLSAEDFGRISRELMQSRLCGIVQARRCCPDRESGGMHDVSLDLPRLDDSLWEDLLTCRLRPMKGGGGWRWSMERGKKRRFLAPVTADGILRARSSSEPFLVDSRSSRGENTVVTVVDPFSCARAPSDKRHKADPLDRRARGIFDAQ